MARKRGAVLSRTDEAKESSRSKDIEITPEIARAGGAALSSCDELLADLDPAKTEAYVIEVFEAMAALVAQPLERKTKAS